MTLRRLALFLPMLIFLIYAHKFPDFDDTAHTMVLLGQGCGEAMAAQLLNNNEPYLYSTPLGMALVGTVWTTDKHSDDIGSKQTRFCTALCTRVCKFLSSNISVFVVMPSLSTSN